MIERIKIEVEKELEGLTRTIDRYYALPKISLLLSKEIKNFILRKGKRLRPILFILAYKGFTKKAAAGLYACALSFELLHDFLIVHDDIIDKSDMRRGEPSVHKRLNNLLSGHKNIKFRGEDLSIIIGDIMYAMAMDAFLAIKEEARRKERGLKRFVEGALFTGSGEFIELLSGIEDIKDITEEAIYKIYDCKTAYYSFASPLSIGAILAGADQNQVERLFRCGICLGRAFQIKDDILGLLGKEEEIGKSPLTDLREAKKTLLLWHAYNNSKKREKLFIKKVLRKENVNRADLLRVQCIVSESGALDFAKRKIRNLLKKSEGLIMHSGMRKDCKDSLGAYAKELLAA